MQSHRLISYVVLNRGMAEAKIDEIKDAAKHFVESLKKQDVHVKAWNVAVGKEGEATNIKISVEVNVTSRKK